MKKYLFSAISIAVFGLAFSGCTRHHLIFKPKDCAEAKRQNNLYATYIRNFFDQRYFDRGDYLGAAAEVAAFKNAIYLLDNYPSMYYTPRGEGRRLVTLYFFYRDIQQYARQMHCNMSGFQANPIDYAARRVLRATGRLLKSPTKIPPRH